MSSIKMPAKQPLEHTDNVAHNKRQWKNDVAPKSVLIDQAVCFHERNGRENPNFELKYAK